MVQASNERRSSTNSNHQFPNVKNQTARRARRDAGREALGAIRLIGIISYVRNPTRPGLWSERAAGCIFSPPPGDPSSAVFHRTAAQPAERPEQINTLLGTKHVSPCLFRMC